MSEGALLNLRAGLINRLIVGVGLTLACASGAFGQSFNSFHSWTAVSGVHVDEVGSLGYTVSLDAGATMVWNGSTYTITDIFGFWCLSSSSSVGLSSTGVNQSHWKYDTDNNNACSGWDDNSKTYDIPPAVTFYYDTLDKSKVADYGLHFTIKDNQGLTQTAFFKGTLVSDTPEPVTSSLLAASALLFVRRRLRRRVA